MIVDIRAALIRGGALVAAARIGQSTGAISPAAAAVVLASVLSVVLFPGAALTVLADHRREVPRWLI